MFGPHCSCDPCCCGCNGAPAPDPTSTCSYCPHPAAYVGRGQDGESYCEDHRGTAPGGVFLITDDPPTSPDADTVGTLGWCEGHDARYWHCQSATSGKRRARHQVGARLMCGSCKKAHDSRPSDR